MENCKDFRWIFNFLLVLMYFCMYQSKKLKNKTFFFVFGPLRFAPSGSHNSALRSKFKKCLDEFIWIITPVILTKFHNNWLSGSLWIDFGSGNWVAHIIIWSLLYSMRQFLSHSTVIQGTLKIGKKYSIVPRANERSGTRAKRAVLSEWVSGASERVSGWARGSLIPHQF